MGDSSTVMKWRYYGRTGGGPTIFEVLRFPDNGQGLDHQDWSKFPEWLQPDGSWVFYPNDITICNERLNGNFDDDTDEITSEQVAQLFRRWHGTNWPGRKRPPAQ